MQTMTTQPDQLIIYNDSSHWEEYQDQFIGDQLAIVSIDSTLFVTCELSQMTSSSIIQMNWFSTIKVWDKATLQITGKVVLWNEDILNIQISPNNKWIVYYTHQNVKVLETHNLNLPPILIPQKPTNSFTTIFTPDSKYLISGGNPLLMCNLEDQSQQPITIDCRSHDVRSIKCGRNILVSCNKDNIQIWNTQTNRNVHYWNSQGQINSSTLSKNQKILLTIGEGDSIKMWSTITKKIIRKYGESSSARGGQVDLSPNGQLMISNRCFEDCLLWNMISGDCITLDSTPGMRARYLFSSDGRYIIRSSQNKRVKMWQINQ